MLARRAAQTGRTSRGKRTRGELHDEREEPPNWGRRASPSARATRTRRIQADCCRFPASAAVSIFVKHVELMHPGWMVRVKRPRDWKAPRARLSTLARQ